MTPLNKISNPVCNDTVKVNPDETLDILESRGLRLVQPRYGYRFSVDVLLLADFAQTGARGRVMDMGCGCGVVGLLLAHKPQVKQVTGLELQPEMADLARRNVELNGLNQKMEIIQGDLRRSANLQVCDLSACPHAESFKGNAGPYTFRPGDRPKDQTIFKKWEFDMVVANPPYWRAASGRLNPQADKAYARHELTFTLEDLAGACAYLVRPRGKINLIYPAARLAEVIAVFHRHRLEAKRLQLIYPNAESEATMFLLSASPQVRPGLRILPPLFVSGPGYL